jgi:hypothetical protein
MLPHRTLVTLASLGLALIATLLVVGFETQSGTPSTVLAQFPADAVDQAEITGPAGKTALRRTPDRWMFLKPVEDWADAGGMDKLVQGLSRLRVRETIADGEIKDATVGLNSSRAILVQLGFGPEKRPTERLLFGRPGPFEDTVYARIEGHRDRRGVFLVETPVHPILLDPDEHLRERRLFPFPATSIRSYSFRQGNLDVELTRDAKEPRWFLTRPIQCRANDDIAYSILEELAAMRASRFIEDRGLSAGTQNTQGAAAFVIRSMQGDAVNLTLEAQAPQETGPAMLAQIGGRTTVLQISDDLVARLPRALEQFRFPTLVEFDKDTVAQIIIESRTDPKVELKSDGRRWDLFSYSQSWPAREERIKRLLNALLTEPVLEFRSNSSADLQRFGLDRPDLRLTVVTSSVEAKAYDAYRQKLRLAQAEGRDPSTVPSPNVEVERLTLAFRLGPDGLLNANLAGTPFIYGIDPALLSDSIPTHPIKWRDPQILTFSLFETRGIDIAENGMPEMKLTYNYLQNTWSGTRGGTQIDPQIDARRAERLAVTLGNLRARDYLTSRAAAYEALRKPSCTVKIRTAGRGDDSLVERRLVFAPAVESAAIEFYYAQFVDEADVFVIDASIYGEIVHPVIRPNSGEGN